MKSILKKLLKFTLVLMFIFNMALISVEAVNADLKVLVNNEQVNFPDAKPFINKDDRTLVPVRFIAENLGCQVEWNGEIKQVGIKNKEKQIELNIGESEAYVNEEKIVFDTKAIIKDDRTFVPLRFVSEALGARVEWDGESRTIHITTKIEKAQLPKIDKGKILEELKKYPTDHTDEKKDIGKANEYTNKFDSDETISQYYSNAKSVMELLYNRDYRKMKKNYKTELLYFFNGWWTYKNERYAPADLIDKWIDDTKTDKIVQKAIFVSDSSMVYNSNAGGYNVRGRLFLNYTSHSNINNANLELEQQEKVTMQIEKWYQADVDVVFYCPVTNAPRPEEIKHAEWVYDTLRYLDNFKEVK